MGKGKGKFTNAIRGPFPAFICHVVNLCDVNLLRVLSYGPTHRQLLNCVNLTETFDEIGGISRKTKGTTRREELVRPKLTTVTFTNNETLDKEVQDFLAENGDIHASKDTIEMFASLRIQEKVLVAKKKKTWTHETNFTRALLAYLLEAVSLTLFSITNISFLFSIRPTRMARGRSQIVHPK